jgi:heme a synthase
VFGGFVRLSNAGLSCPDWPTCYGRATWPKQDHEVAKANENYERPVEVHKAWREQVHRHAAAVLGLLVFLLALLSVRRKRSAVLGVVSAAAMVAVSIWLYMKANYSLSAGFLIAGELLMLAMLWRARDQEHAKLSLITLMVIIFQATLGLWTVTWLLKPVVVMGHLLGGLTTFSLLLALAWRSTPNGRLVHGVTPRLRPWLWVGLLLLVVQIALGGWTSANYAALACGNDFPTCLGQWWPEHDFKEAAVLWRGIGVDYEGGVLDGPARVAIQLAHRVMAIIVSAYLLLLSLRMLFTIGLRYWGAFLLVALALQVALGISNVVFNLPLWVATAHNAGAVLLLFVMISLLARLKTPE